MEKVSIFYDKMSYTYDEWMKAGESALSDELDLVLKTFRFPCRILDVGCGTGRISVPLQNLNYQVVGVDISRGMIAQAKKKGLKEAYIADFSFFEYESQYFDGIISLHAGFSYTSDLNIMINMVNKCSFFLSNNGRILWDSPNYEYYGKERKLEWQTENGLVITNCYGHDSSELTGLFQQAGFYINNIWGSYTPLLPFSKGAARIIIEAKVGK